MFSDAELTILTLYSSRLGLYLLSGLVVFLIALVLKKQRVTIAKYLFMTSILYFLSILAMPVYAGFAGASADFNELSYRVFSEGIELVAALLLILNLVLTFIGIKALSSKSS